MHVACGNCLSMHDHERSVDVFSYDPRNESKTAWTIDITLGYDSLNFRQLYILLLNQAIYNKGLSCYLVCPT